jgi:hypothetical protein
MIRRLIVPLVAAIVSLHAGEVFAQGAFPAPLPGTDPAPSPGTTPAAGLHAGVTPFANGPFAAPSTQAGPADDCSNGYLSLREEAERRGKLIKAAGDRHALPDEACKLIGNFAEIEIKMIKYVEAHTASCGIPPQISDQLKNGHKNTEAMQQKVCFVARQTQKRGSEPLGPTGDFWIRGKQL